MVVSTVTAIDPDKREHAVSCCYCGVSSEELLRSAGLRVTRPRLAVLDILAGGGHLEVEEITRRARQRLESVSTQAVYDVLGALSRAGLARRIEPAGSPALFEARVGDNHHHVVCRGCGVVSDIDGARGAAPCLDPENANGFQVDEAEVTFWGLCPACQCRRGTGA
ncbi:Fur family transcriptional regulator [Plantactinospora sp. GCM10030261]|uniref:Fur family transcriptional regulator n=1 Tax=Plantactinospora sp. GCM10030261 TaxID=3273420 RepID=UPI00361C8E11